MVARPTGTVTFLFTDIEGSTRRWEQDTPDMANALARHDDVLRAAIESHDGWLFKHTGDGVVAAFSSPAGAIEAAVTAQRDLDLPVRMGIATGEAERRGDDYFGPALNRTARIMGAGHGGQILVGASTAELVDGFDLLDLGEHRLRDLSRTQHLFQVRAEGLRDSFPPLKTLDTAPGNLPSQVTSFIGRERDVVEVVEALREHRLVTLTGVGGVGKTRLALEVAADLAPEFPDGIWLIELAPVGDPDAVPDAVASVLGITQHTDKTVAESVAEALAGRTRLLVLDNCEHILDAAAELAELILARAPDVKILATSREGLSLPGEHIWRVPSLDVREGVDSASVTLFTERARAVAPDFSIKREPDATAVVETCRRLDGIPLAIELAAARMGHMSPAEIRDRLQDRFRLLSGSRRGLERHQTLRNAVQWSYDLLDDGERTLLCGCSVFAGGFDLDAASAVGGGAVLDEYAILDLLGELVRKSLVTVEHADGGTRYGMLETIRQFAEDQLAVAGAGDEARDRHARHFAGKEAEILAIWNSADQRDANEWLDVELANLRTAFHWAADRGDIDNAAAIAVTGAFIGFWTLQPEPGGWSEALIDRAGAVDHPRLASLYAMASQCFSAGRFEDGARYGDTALPLLRDPTYDPFPFWHGELRISLLHFSAGRFDRAEALCREMESRTGEARVVIPGYLAHILAMQGRFDEAMSLAAAEDTAPEALENPYVRTAERLSYATVFRTTRPLEARAALQQALAMSRSNLIRGFEAHVASQLAPLEAEWGDMATALDLLREGLHLNYDGGNVTGVAVSAGGLAVCLLQLGDAVGAARFHGTCMAITDASIFPGLPEAAERLREILGTDEFDRLTAEGAAMSPAEIVRQVTERIAEAHKTLEASP